MILGPTNRTGACVRIDDVGKSHGLPKSILHRRKTVTVQSKADAKGLSFLHLDHNHYEDREIYGERELRILDRGLTLPNTGHAKVNKETLKR